MSFYLKLLLIFSFVGQSIAVACVDTIVGRYDARRKLFNTSSYEGKLKQDAPEINDHSQKIEGILVDEKRVDVNRSATINEKEKIVKAVIAERFIAKKVQMTLSGQRTSDINPYKKICTDLALAGHFKVLELTWDFADEARNYFSDDVIKIDFSKFSANKYEDLYSLLGIDESLCKEWFAEMFYEHFAGLQNPETCEEIRDSYSRGLEISCGDSERNKEVRLSYLFKSFAEVSSHPFAFYAASELLNKRKYIPIEIAMNAFRVIAENDEHTCQYHAAVWLLESDNLSKSDNPDDTRIAMNAFRCTARNNGHEDQYYAAERLFESDNPDDIRIAIDTFVHIATDTMDTNQCNAAERLIQLEADEYGGEYGIAMDALKLTARNNGHENQYFAAKTLVHSVGDDNYDIAMDALRFTARNNKHDYQYHAAEVLFESDDANDQKIAMDALRFIAGDGDSPNQYCAAEQLFELGNPDDTRIAMNAFRVIAEDDEHTCQYDAAVWLFESGNPDDTRIAMNAFRVIAENDEHTCQYDAAVWLFESGNPDDTRIAMNAFRRTARNNGHENQYFAAEQLFESGNPDDTRIAIDTFVHIATDTMDTNQCNAAERLIQLEADEYGDEYVIAMDALRLAARNNGHENQYFAAKALLHSVGDGNYDIAMDALRLTARNNNHDYQYHAAEVLFESDDANDQKIAMDALRFIAEDGDSPNQYCAAERLIQLRERNP